MASNSIQTSSYALVTANGTSYSPPHRTVGSGSFVQVNTPSCLLMRIQGNLRSGSDWLKSVTFLTSKPGSIGKLKHIIMYGGELSGPVRNNKSIRCILQVGYLKNNRIIYFMNC